MRIKSVAGLVPLALLSLLVACSETNPLGPSLEPSLNALPAFEGPAQIQATFSAAVLDNPGYYTPPVYCGGAGQQTCAQFGLAVPPTVQARWGVPAGSASPRSGLGFEASSATISANQEFQIGTLTHFNFPIVAGSGASAVTLTFNLSVGELSSSFPVTFEIDETSNSGAASACPYPSVTPCSDKVSWSLPEPRAIEAGGNVYALNIKGFRSSANSPPIDGFISQEGGTTTGVLIAELVDATAQTRAINDAFEYRVGEGVTVAAKGVLANDAQSVVSATVARAPEHGTLQLSSNGGFVYTPSAGFSGVDSFVYFGRSSDGQLSLAVVTLSPDDNVPPVITVPADLTVEATGATTPVSWTAPTALDGVDGAVAVTCSRAPGSAFALGATTVTCTASDAAGNAASASFTVTVLDRTAPALSVPGDLTVEATSLTATEVSWPVPTAADAVDGSVAVTCSRAPGSAFPLGLTTVTCSATDAAGNSASESFGVTVRDRTAPTLSLPDDIEAFTAGSDGAIVTYSATASDAVYGSVSVTCTPASGSRFSVGSTTVTCTAQDGAGNTASGSFAVEVVSATELAAQLVDLSTGVGPGKSLAQLASNINASLSRGSISSACGQLGAFISQVNAQEGKSLTTQQAAQLRAAATQIRTLIGC